MACKQRRMKVVQKILPTWFCANQKIPRIRSVKKKTNPMALYHKKLGMITMCSMHNGGYLRVCAGKRNSETHRTNRWDQQQYFQMNQVITVIRKNMPAWVQVLQQPNTHPKIHSWEYYIPTIHHPLASIQVQLEGYLGLIVWYHTCGHSQHISV